MANKEKSLKLLQEHLKGEEIKHCIFGSYNTTLLGEKQTRSGIMVATETKIVFYGKRAFGFDMEEFPFSNISSFEKGKNMMGSYINFFSSGNKVEMKWIKDKDFDNFVNYVKQNIGKKSSTVTVTKESSSDEIRKYKDLLDEGIISEEEFNAKKKQLLGI